MPGVYQCDVCEHYYNSAERKPLCLPCGHDFCRDCLSKLRLYKNCPTCDTKFTCDVDSLPVIYSLIPKNGEQYFSYESQKPSSSNEGFRRHNEPPPSYENSWKDDYVPPRSNESSCHEHKFVREFWCSSCHYKICKKCLIGKHSSCKTMLVEDVINDFKLGSPVTEAVNVLKQKLDVDLAKTEAALTRNRDSLATVVEFLSVVENVRGLLKSEITSLQQHRKVLTSLSNDVRLLTGVPYNLRNAAIDQHRQVLEWSTTHQIETVNRNQEQLGQPQLKKIAELCSFAKSFKMPQPEHDAGWFGGWGSYFYGRGG
ncbi:uncharacterized protein LOC108675528 [Hyalella azteca]|uniref:Uncharacterized protein LOC108675528 n=1 Tax=Hyalella azteca TaxID=294128 RepID=A0A8B7NZ65_HYAAZ|nr:uncharacterized protein LOC108675528 [Hyalella azteca]